MTSQSDMFLALCCCRASSIYWCYASMPVHIPKISKAHLGDDLGTFTSATASSRVITDCPKAITSIFAPQIANHVCNGQWNALRSAACNNHLEVLNLLIG
ncbi:hypothetical protein COOONC_15241 [Cooperia oncophora]